MCGKSEPEYDKKNGPPCGGYTIAETATDGEHENGLDALPVNERVLIRLAGTEFMWHMNRTGKELGQCVHLDTIDGSNKEMVLSNRKNGCAVLYSGSKRYIDVEGNRDQYGKVLHQWHEDIQSKPNNQIFQFEAVRDEPGLYYIKTFCDRYAGCEGEPVMHAKIVQLDKTPNPMYKWEVTPITPPIGPWQSQLLSRLGSRADSMTIADVYIPGTHDSGTAAGIHWGAITQCQTYYIREQLQIGVRYFDIRCDTRDKSCDPKISHGNCICRDERGDKLLFSKVISDMMAFLHENPDEFILLQVKCETGAADLLGDVVSSYKKSLGKKFYTIDKIPFLSDAKGKIVLIRRFPLKKEYQGTDMGIDAEQWPDNAHSVNHGAVPIPKGWREEGDVYVQDRYTTTGDRKKKYVLSTLKQNNTLSPRRLVLNFTSCVYMNPRSAAHTVNAYTMEILASPKTEKAPCVIICDFAALPLTNLIIQQNGDLPV